MTAPRMNPREAEILEQARNRKMAIQNMQRDNLEAATIWRDKQVKSYGNMVSVTEEVPLSKIITDEQQAQSQDDFYKGNMQLRIYRNWPIKPIRNTLLTG